MAPQYARTKSRYVFWSRLLSGAVVLFPLSLTQMDFRSSFSVGVSVAANKSSPAYAAFEDLRESYHTELADFPEPATLLAPDSAFDPEYLISQHAAERRHIVLSGTTVRAPEAKPAPLEAKPFYVAGHTLRRAPKVHRSDLVDQVGDLLAMPGSLHAKPEEVSKPSASRALKERVIRSQTGTTIIVRQATEDLRDERPSVTVAANPVRESQYNEDSFGYVTPLAAVRSAEDTQRPLWLNGQVEMTGGLAFVGPETQIVVKRVMDGSVYERGRIWVSEGKFEIHVKKALGYLVAELQTRDGRVLGRGEINLVHLHEVPRKDNRISDIRIALRPTTEVASFHVSSGDSYGDHKLPVRGSRMQIQAYNEPKAANDEGVVTEPTLTRDSSFVVRATAKKHWSSLVIGQAKHPQDIRLFSNSLVEALINIETTGTDRKEAMNSGVVWGQIARSGGPVAGARVEMAGGYKAIYFNEAYLPDRSLKATSKNGVFAFVKVKAGVQALRVKVGGKLYPAQVFPTENKHVSYVDLEIRDKVVSQFKVIDVLDLPKPLSAQLRLVGTDEVLSLTGNELVEYAVSGNPFMVEADAGTEYEISRVTLTGAPHLIQIPMLRRDWIHDLYNHKDIRTVPGRGIVVGFVDEVDFEVDITGRAADEKLEIVYFDAQGKPLTSGSGQRGGGFIIFNAPMGLQTVYVQPLQGAVTFSQVVVPEPGFVHVMTWSPQSN